MIFICLILFIKGNETRFSGTVIQLKFRKFGWNGLLFDVPEEMRFTRQGGNAKSGNFMLESEDCLVEAKWQPIPKRPKPISSIVGTIVEQMEKYEKKKKRDKRQTVKILGKETAHVYSHDALYIVVKAQVEERYYIWYCNESERIIILRFVFKTFDDKSRRMLKRMVDSMKCHGEGFNVWSLMNLRFETPVSFLLTESNIRVGRAQFLFTDNQLSMFTEKTSTILLEYFSMANLLFKDTYKDIDKWFEKNYRKDLSKQLKKRKIKFQLAKPRKLRRHKVVVKQAKMTSGVSWRTTTIYTNATWYCSGSNRIYSVTVASSIKRPILFKRILDEAGHAKMVDDFLSSIKCH